MKPAVTWIVVADQDSARVFSHRSGEREFEAVPGGQLEAGPINEPSDKPGRTFASGGSRRHTYEAPLDAGTEILEKVIEVLEKGASKKAYSRFVLCAPPKLLGQMRDAIPGQLSEMNYAELPKTLINTPEGELPNHFKDLLLM